ncbi:AAA family ATPase [Alcanivorax sp. IL3]|uniref:AAA family ATPase n=1 Tax=unclassified Alcanivorax TaxID=2638842 RepID=UPI0039C311B7
MLIEIAVENYRSFRDRQVFSMVAAGRLRKRDNVFAPDVDGEKLPNLLKVAAIYGPNASGKSNFVKALNLVTVLASMKPGEEFPFKNPIAFRFDRHLSDKPSKFEIHFIANRVRYQFNVALDINRIHEERLIAYPKGKERLLYERSLDEAGNENYIFGESLEGGEEVNNVWKKLTGPRSLFISQAVANSSDDLQQLKHPFSWLSSGLAIVQSPSLMQNFAKALQKVMAYSPEIMQEVVDFLKENDIPVSGIRFDETSFDGDETSELKESDLYNEPKRKMILSHETNLGKADFYFSEESEGTRNLLGFWLPWMLKNKNDSTSCLVVDELDSSLHPHIVCKLVASHISAKNNSAQLIFTTHDTHLMDSKLMRRDQFWITDRDSNGATVLFSVHDFEGRESEDIEKRYYEGRYKGLPIVKGV